MKSSILAAIFAASVVSAHGGLKYFNANDKKYDAPPPGSSAGDSPVWSINSVEPVTDKGSPEMKCGRGGQSGSGVAKVSAGSDVAFQLANGEGGPWVHILGLTSYQIYGCGDAPCDPTGDNWAALAWDAGDGNGGYVMGKFGRGEDVQVHIPKNVPNGNYVIRQELLADHVSAEWYVQCVNVEVVDGPSGKLADTGAQMFSIPGMWKGDEAALKWSPFGTNSNDFPIPSIAVIEEKDAPAAPAPEEPSAPAEPSEPAEPSTPPPAGGGNGSCAARRKAKRAGTAAAAAARRQESVISRRAPSKNWRTGVMHN